MKDSRIWLGSAGKTPCSGVLCRYCGMCCTSLLCAVLHGCAVLCVCVCAFQCEQLCCVICWSAMPSKKLCCALVCPAVLCCAVRWNGRGMHGKQTQKRRFVWACSVAAIVLCCSLQPCFAALCAICACGRALLCAAVLPVCSCALVCSAVCGALLCSALCGILLCYVCVVFE